MSSEGLRDTFALLLRDRHAPAATLSADAVREIRRRVGLRWVGRVGALVVVGTIGGGCGECLWRLGRLGRRKRRDESDSRPLHRLCSGNLSPRRRSRVRPSIGWAEVRRSGANAPQRRERSETRGHAKRYEPRRAIAHGWRHHSFGGSGRFSRRQHQAWHGVDVGCRHPRGAGRNHQGRVRRRWH